MALTCANERPTAFCFPPRAVLPKKRPVGDKQNCIDGGILRTRTWQTVKWLKKSQRMTFETNRTVLTRGPSVILPSPSSTVHFLSSALPPLPCAELVARFLQEKIVNLPSFERKGKETSTIDSIDLMLAHVLDIQS